jgi:hypothetical protein
MFRNETCRVITKTKRHLEETCGQRADLFLDKSNWGVLEKTEGVLPSLFPFPFFLIPPLLSSLSYTLHLLPFSFPFSSPPFSLPLSTEVRGYNPGKIFEFTDAYLCDLVRFDQQNQHLHAPIFVLKTFF